MSRRWIIAAVAAAALSGHAQYPGSSSLIGEYTRMLEQKPGDYDLLLSRAAEYLDAGMYLPALDDLDAVLKLAPKSEKEIIYEARTRKASILALRGDTDGAVSELTAAAALFPDAGAPIAERARILMRAGRYDEARRDWLKVLRRSPRDAAAAFGVAEAAARAGDAATARRYMVQGNEMAPGTAGVLLASANVLDALGLHAEAMDSRIRAAFSDGSDAATAAQTLIDLSQTDYAGVLRGLERALASQPGQGMLYYLRAAIEQDHGDHEEALRDYDTIDGRGPFAGHALAALRAESLLALDRPTDALDALMQLAAPRRNADWHNVAGRVYLRLLRYDDALTEAETVLAGDPSDAAAQELKGDILAAQDLNAEAVIQYALALMADNSRPEPYLKRAWALRKLDREEEARAMCEQLLDLPYEPTDASGLQGFAYWMLGQTDQARGWLARITAHGTPDNRTRCIADRLTTLLDK